MMLMHRNWILIWTLLLSIIEAFSPPRQLAKSYLKTFTLASDKTPIGDLLHDLDQRGIRYAPSATREELEKLLLQETRNNIEENLMTSSIQQEEQQQEKIIPPPLPLLIRKLDESGIRYAPSASRADLEILWQELRASNNSSTTTTVAAANFDTTTNNTVTTPSNDLLRHASRVSNKNKVPAFPTSSQYLNTLDESPNPNSPPNKKASAPPFQRTKTTTTPTPTTREILNALDRRRIRYPPDASRTDLELLLKQSNERIRRRRRRQGSNRSPYTTTKIPRRQRRSSYYYAEDETTNNNNERRNNENRRTNQERYPSQRQPQPYDDVPSKKERTIFNPTGVNNNNVAPSPIMMMDGSSWDVIDRFGDAVADAAGTIDVDSWDVIDRFGDAVGDVVADAAETIEGQVGAFLGMDDNYYEEADPITTKQQQQEKNGGSSSIRSTQLRRTKPSDNKLSQNNKKKNKSIWEEGEDSILSLLFGRGAGPTGLRTRFEKIFDQDVGTNALTKFLGSLSRGALLVLNYLCRWASVKGTIPQPVVVMAVVSVALSTRRRKVNAVFLTVLITRTVGELLHGLATKMKKKNDDDKPQENAIADGEIPPVDASKTVKKQEIRKECWDGDGL
mmetsp:Transcript_18065/g.27312  ORF Transcript_18065/g.27312 Transcript_18065/m.27312 type:complete len:619 (+) Transcript_18065:81-1937(+)